MLDNDAHSEEEKCYQYFLGFLMRLMSLLILLLLLSSSVSSMKIGRNSNVQSGHIAGAATPRLAQRIPATDWLKVMKAMKAV
jgi:hypothetical protein